MWAHQCNNNFAAVFNIRQMRLFIVTILLLGALILPTNLFAAMSSTDYYIYADTIDSGGVFSIGGEYSLDSSLGESPVGIMNDGTYEIRGGYQAMDRGYISLSISDSSLNLGTLSTSTVSSASTTATVSTDAGTGYSLTVGSAIWSGGSLQDVVGGTVTAGTEAFGVAGSGAENQLTSGDVAVTSSLLIAASVAPIVGSATVLEFKAAISSTTVAGSYSQTVVLTASANF